MNVSHNIPPELAELNSILMSKGWHDLSSWWKDQIGRVYADKKTRAVFRVGRRGGKSQTVCRIAVFEALFGRHEIPPGDVGEFGIVSADRDQAKARVNTIKSIFEALEIGGVKIYADRVELKEKRIAIKVFTASHSGVVGGTAIGWMLDEMTRWRDKDTGSNPAKEVINSLMPSISTMPNAKVWFISSPYSTIDVHYEAVEQGTNEYQHVGIAPSWIANPTLSIERTKILEPDPIVWSREYEAIPMASSEYNFFSPALIKEAQVPFEVR